MPITIPYTEIEATRRNIIQATNDQSDIINRFNALQQQHPYVVFPSPMEAIAQIYQYEMRQYTYVIELLNATIRNISIDHTLSVREKTCGFIVCTGLLVSWSLEYQIRTRSALQISSEVQDLQKVLIDYNKVQLQEVLTNDAAYITFLEHFVLLTLRSGNIYLLDAAVRNGARLYDSQKVLRNLQFRSQSPHHPEIVDLLRILTTKPEQVVTAQVEVQQEVTTTEEEKEEKNEVIEQQQAAPLQVQTPPVRIEEAPTQAAAAQEEVTQEEEVGKIVAEPRHEAPRLETLTQKLSPADCFKTIQSKSSTVQEIHAAWTILLELSDLEFYTLEVEYKLPPLQALSGLFIKHNEKVHNNVKAKRNKGFLEYSQLHPQTKPVEVKKSPVVEVKVKKTESIKAVVEPTATEQTNAQTTLTVPELLALVKAKGAKPDDTLLKLLTAHQLSIDLCQKLLAITNLSPKIIDIILNKICDPQFCSAHDFFILYRRFDLQNMANELEALSVTQTTIATSIKDRIETSKVWASIEVQIILPGIFAKQDLNVTDKLNLAIFAEQKNALMQTPLMLALKSNKEVAPVSEVVFNALLESSNSTLLEPDVHGDSVLFYATRYFDAKLDKVLFKLFDKCVKVSIAMKHVRPGHVLPCMLDPAGNTFLHEYFKRDDNDGEMLQGFKLWEYAAKELPDKEDFVRSLILVKNDNNETVLDILNKKDKDLPKSADYIYQLLPTTIYKFFANIHNATFALNSEAILHLYATEQFDRLIKTLDRRLILRQEVNKALGLISKTHKKRFEKIPELLGENELSSMRIGEFLLFDLISVYALNHPEHREMLINSKAYQDVWIKFIPISLEVRVLKKQAKNGNPKPLPRYVIPAIKRAMTAINSEAILHGRLGIFFDNVNILKLVHEECEVPVTDIEIFYALSELDFANKEVDAEKLKFILAHFRKTAAFTDQFTYTVFLHLVANAHDADKIKWLVNNGLDPSVIHEGWTVLHFLLHEGVSQDHKFIIAVTKAVLSNPDTRRTLLEFRDEIGNGCLELASTKLTKLSEDNLFELFETLLDYGADLTAMRSTADLKNALHWVAFTGSQKLIYLFTQHLTKEQFLAKLKTPFSVKSHNIKSTDIYAYMQRIMPNAPKVIVSHEDFRQIELQLSDPNIPNDRFVSTVLDDCNIKVDSILTLLKTEPNNIELRNQLLPLIQVPMKHGKTVLMLCFEQDLPLEVIDFVLDHSKHSLHKWNYQQEMILHVWARYYTTKRLPLFAKIVALSKEHAYTIPSDKVMFALTQSDVASDTFLHALAHGASSDLELVNALRNIFVTAIMPHFARLAISKNSAFQTPACIVESKPTDWSMSVAVLHELMLRAISGMQDLSVSAEGTPKLECIMFHDIKGAAFKQIVEQSDYYRLISILDRNFKLQTRIVAAKPKDDLMPFFDATRTLEIQIYGQSLFMHAANHLFATDDTLLEDKWLNSECYLLSRNRTSVRNSFEFRRVIAALEKDDVPDPKYAVSLAKYVDYGLQQSALDEIILERVPLDIKIATKFVQYILRNIDEQQRTDLVRSEDINHVTCFETSLSMILQCKRTLDENEELTNFMLRAYDLLNILLMNGAQPAQIRSANNHNIMHFIAMIGDLAIASLILRYVSKVELSQLLMEKSSKDNLTVKEFAQAIYAEEGEITREFHRYFMEQVCSQPTVSGQELEEASAESLLTSAVRNKGFSLSGDL